MDTPNEEQLDKLEEDIEKARADAAEVVDGVGAEAKESFVDSGSDKDDDDQTIAPG